MKDLLQSRRSLFIIGFLLLLAVNLLVLAGVAANRRAPAESQVVLTERELKWLNHSHSENSGMTLKLNWRVFVDNETAGLYSTWTSPEWFGMEKLKELGFSFPVDLHKNGVRKRKRPHKKEAVIVLEKNSSCFRKSVDIRKKAVKKVQQQLELEPENQELRNRLERLETQLRQEQISGSRLFAVDAGLNPDKLRQQYPDRHRYLLVRGVVGYRYDFATMAGGKSEPRGYVSRLNNGVIHVSLPYRKRLDTLIAEKKNGESPRYRIELTYGQRLEPWITGVYSVEE